MRIKYDVQDVEGGQDFDTPVPIGVYPAKIDSIAEEVSKSSGNDMLVVIYKLSGGDWKGRLLWDYIVLNEASAWKLKQFVDALGLKGKGSLDTKKLVGEAVRVRVRHDSSKEFGTRAKVQSVLPLHVDDEEEPDDEEPDDDEDDVAATEDTGDDAEITFEDLDEYEMDDLKELNDAEELGVRITAKSKVETVRTKVADALGLEPAEEDEPDDDDDDEESEDEEAEDYSEWDLADLKAEAKERGLSTAGTKKTLVKKLEKDDEGDEPF